MDIKVLGAGCPKCKKLEENVGKAVASANIDAKVEKVTDIKTIMEYGVMMTPALVINGAVASAGKLLSVEEIKVMITGV